jgi:hypothetical protein
MPKPDESKWLTEAEMVQLDGLMQRYYKMVYPRDDGSSENQDCGQVAQEIHWHARAYDGLVADLRDEGEEPE